MDYKDFLSGKTEETFYFKAKNRLINIIMKKIKKKIFKNNDEKFKILNLGVGMGNDLKIFKKYGENYIIDINDKALNQIDKRLYTEKKKEDACNLSYKDNFFDIVVALGVLEHVKEDNKLINEAYRTLKTGGVFVFEVPCHQFLFSSHDVALEHYRRYSNKRIIKLLARFNNLEIFYWNFLLFIPVMIMRIFRKKSEPKVDNMKVPRFIDNILYYILNFENNLIKSNIKVPTGIGLIGYCQKPL